VKRLLPLLLLSLALAPAPGAHGNGCPAPCSGQVASPPDAKLLYVQPRGEGGPLVAYATPGGARAFGLPAGRASWDGRWHVAAFPGLRTTVVRYRVATGAPADSFQIPGRYTVAAVSPTGRWVALARRAKERTEILVADVVARAPAHVLSLRGDFEVETVSADGTRLFLIQHLHQRGAPRYVVRLYDLRRERLQAEPLRAESKSRLRFMTGYAWGGVGSPDGRWLLTLYLDTKRTAAFVHALDLEHSQPACIDLPSGRGELKTLERYTLTLAPDGRRLYAANPILGVVSEIHLGAGHGAHLSARFPPAPRGRAPVAKLGGTISANGRTLYFSDGRDLWAYDTAYRRVRGPYRTGGELVGFGYGKGGRTVFALRKDGRMVGFDAATGQRLGA
jgi:hypothetical protein